MSVTERVAKEYINNLLRSITSSFRFNEKSILLDMNLDNFIANSVSSKDLTELNPGRPGVILPEHIELIRFEIEQIFSYIHLKLDLI